MSNFFSKAWSACIIIWLISIPVTGVQAEELAKEQIARLAGGVDDIGTVDPDFAVIDSVSVADPYTLKIKTQRIYPDLPTLLAGYQGGTYNLFLGWDEDQLTFRIDDQEASYRPLIVIHPPNIPWKGIGTRIWNPAGREATIEALYDDVMVNLILPGDCNGDGQTTIDEIQKSINQFLEVSPVEPCNDLNGDGRVTIDELQKVINAFLGLKDPYEFEAVTISPSGGTYYLPNGIVLEVPQGAVSEPVTVRLRGVREEEVMPILQSYGLTEKYFMAAYDAEPKGFKFNKPINIFLPSKPLENSTALPFLFDVNFVTKIYSPAMLPPQPVTGALKNSGSGVKTDLILEVTPYISVDCTTNQLIMRDITELPVDEVVQAIASINQTSNSNCAANPCECCWVEIRELGADYQLANGGTGCVNMTITGSATFFNCPGQPVENWSLVETNLG